MVRLGDKFLTILHNCKTTWFMTLIITFSPDCGCGKNSAADDVASACGKLILLDSFGMGTLEEWSLRKVLV